MSLKAFRDLCEHINDDIEALTNTIKDLNDDNYSIIIRGVFDHDDPNRTLTSDDIFHKIQALDKKSLQDLSNLLGYGKLSEKTINGDEDLLLEVAPPEMENWVKSNKERFIKQYGKNRGIPILYATAWKIHNKE